MRALVFLLILANLLFFAWTQGYFGDPASADALRLQQQLQADRIKIVARDEPPAIIPATPAKTEKPPSSDVCLLLADLPAADLSHAETLLTDRFPEFRTERKSTAVSSSYWVFVPPLKNKQEAERKAAELKQAKVPEFFILQEPPNLRFAISLGIFSSREAAEERLVELRSKGVRSAKVGERDPRPASGSLEIRGPGERSEALREAIVETLPKNKLSVCKVKTIDP